MRALLLIICLLSTLAQAQQKKIALVIGAQNYTSLPALRHSLNDARAMTATLQSKGFQVRTLYDPKTRAEIKEGTNWYFNQMVNKVGAVGLIYYAGHGIQYQGDNYIVPTSVALQNPSDLEDCVKMNGVIEILNATSRSLNILLLDACRTLPSFTRGSEQGLSKMSPPEGSIIVFATTAGKVASDGTGTNGLFTSKLLKALNEPGLNVNDVFRKVQRDVYSESGKKQLPELDDLAIGGDFYFTPGSKGANQDNSIPLTQQAAATTMTVYKPFDYGYGAADAPKVTVGSQQWLGKNLNVNHFANGDPIPEAQTPEEWQRANDESRPVWCYYENNLTTGRSIGKLYNWYAVHDPRGLAPAGWHVPSDAEWTELVNQLGGWTSAGHKLKNIYWFDENAENHGGDNSSGLGLDEGGFRRPDDGSFARAGGRWWSSNDDGWFFALERDDRSGSGKGCGRCGFSVRCVQD